MKGSNKSAKNIINKKSIVKTNKSSKNIYMHNYNNHHEINKKNNNTINNLPNSKIKNAKTLANNNLRKSYNNSINVNNKTYNISKLFLKSTKTYNNLFIYIEKDIFNKSKLNLYNYTKIPNNKKFDLSLEQKINKNRKRYKYTNKNENHSLKLIKSISFDNNNSKDNNNKYN